MKSHVDTLQCKNLKEKYIFQSIPTAHHLYFQLALLSQLHPFFKGNIYMFWTRVLGHNFLCNSRLYFQMGIFEQVSCVQYAFEKF